MKRNKIKQSEYKVVSNPLEGFKFSLSGCYAAAIVSFIVGAAIAIGMIVGILLSGSWESLNYGFIYICVPSVIFIYLGVWQMSWTRQIKKIITKGKQVDGKIIKYHKTASNNRTTIYVMFNYHFEQVCEVEAGRKKPEKALASPYCKVYILDDKIFVTDFELRKKGDPAIEFIEKDIQDMNNDQIQ